MRRSTKTIVAALLCGAVTAAASCATGPTYPVTVDGQKIPAGLYIIQQNNAIQSAKAKLKEEQPDLDTSATGFNFLGQTIEGKSFSQWVDDRTIEICRNYAAINNLFDQYGLSLTKAENDEINSYVKGLWNDENEYASIIYGVNVVGKYYETLGVGEASFREYQIVSEKSDKLFEHLYGENGEKAATPEEVKAKLVEDYAAVNYFQYTLESGDGAQSYADRIKNGDSYELVYRDYTAQTIMEAAKKAADEAAAEAGTTEDTAAETTGDTAETEKAADTASPETDTAAGAEETAVPETDSLLKLLVKTDTAPSEDFVKQVFEMENGEVRVITTTSDDKTLTYVVQKVDVTTKPDLTKTAENDIRTALKSDEFQDLIKDTGSGYNVSIDGSKNMYKIETLLNSKGAIYG